MNSNKTRISTGKHGRIVVMTIALTAFAFAGCTNEQRASGEGAASVQEGLHSGTWGGWSDTGPTTQIFGPTVCSNRLMEYVMVSHQAGSSNPLGYQVRANTRFAGTNPAWSQTPTRMFYSPPTCGFLFPRIDSTSREFLLAGRGSGGIYVIVGKDVAQPENPLNPTFAGTWQAVPHTPTFTTISDGYPALAANGGLAPSSSDRVVLTYLNGNRLYAHYRQLPYASNAWSDPIVKQLPAGVASVGGTPGIVYMRGTLERFVIFIRGVDEWGGGDDNPRLYSIYFNGVAFGAWSVSPPMPYPVESDIALDWSQYEVTGDPFVNALTIYFRSGNHIIQTSVPHPGGIGDYPFFPVGEAPMTLLSGPRVSIAGAPEGDRVVVVKGSFPGGATTVLRNHQNAFAEDPYPGDYWPQ